MYLKSLYYPYAIPLNTLMGAFDFATFLDGYKGFFCMGWVIWVADGIGGTESNGKGRICNVVIINGL
mgnify:CR=1 FL=1